MGLLTFAAGLKGANEGAQKGLDQRQAMLSSQALQLGSQDFAREQADTAYTRSRFNVEDERKYTAQREQELYKLGRGRKAAEASEDLETRAGLVEKKALVDRQESDAGKGLRKDLAVEDITNEVTKATMLAENKAWLKAQMILSNAKESSHSRALAEKTMFDLEQGKGSAKVRDAYLALLADPNADPEKLAKAKQAWAGYTDKPGEAEKIDQQSIQVGLREMSVEVTRLQGMLKDQIPGTPEYDALQRRLNNAEAAQEAYDLRLRELTGTKPKVKAKRTVDDPFKDAPTTDEQEAEDISRQQLEKEPKKPTGTINRATGLSNYERAHARP